MMAEVKPRRQSLNTGFGMPTNVHRITVEVMVKAIKT